MWKGVGLGGCIFDPSQFSHKVPALSNDFSHFSKEVHCHNNILETLARGGWHTVEVLVGVVAIVMGCVDRRL